MTPSERWRRLLTGRTAKTDPVGGVSKGAVEETLKSGSTPISQCRPRQVCTVAGRVTRTWEQVEGKGAEFHCKLEDENGETLTATWLGQPSIPGVVSGATVRLRGTLMQDRSGFKMIDPSYTILSWDRP